MVETITDWARRASGFGELTPLDEASAPQPPDRIYRLRHWPNLPQEWKKVEVLRLLSRMSSSPVRRSWVLAQRGWNARRLDTLLQRLAAQGALQEIDTRQMPVLAD